MADDVTTPTQGLRHRERRNESIDGPLSPPSQRPLARASTFAEPSPLGVDRRRNSILSDYSLDEARTSLRSSTDDIFLPRAQSAHDGPLEESTNWHSMPLAFAFFPALGGMFFKNGSAVITDIMLLGLAAVFLNWSVRLPWDWYKSAQSIRLQDTRRNEIDAALEEHSVEEEASSDDQKHDSPGKEQRTRDLHESRAAVSAELQGHEILALLSCFLGPMCGAYLLHTIRAQLSRPSEGLVSNYNLTIFLLAAEVRPLSHLVKMIQGRTLYLQRTLAQNPYASGATTKSHFLELSKRLDALESPAIPLPEVQASTPSDVVIKNMITEVRRSTQPDLDALNRAVRRYEKKAQLQSMQTEARLLDLEQRISNSLAVAAAAIQAQRSQRGFMTVIFDNIYKILLLPFQAFLGLIKFPAKAIGKLFGIRQGKPKIDKDRRGLKPGHARIAQGSRVSKRG